METNLYILGSQLTVGIQSPSKHHDFSGIPKFESIERVSLKCFNHKKTKHKSGFQPGRAVLSGVERTGPTGGGPARVT